MTTLYIVAINHASLNMRTSAHLALREYEAAVRDSTHNFHVALFEMEVEGFDKFAAYNEAYAKMKSLDYVAIAKHFSLVALPTQRELNLDDIDIYSEDALKAAFEAGVEAGRSYVPHWLAESIVEADWPAALLNLKEKYAS